MTITEFLLARIGEDEARAQVMWDEKVRRRAVGQTVSPNWPTPDRTLAECEAKRRIVERGRSQCSGYEDQDEFDDDHHYPDPEWAFCDGCAAAESADADWQWTLRVLASIWAAHPDFQPEWRV